MRVESPLERLAQVGTNRRQLSSRRIFYTGQRRHENVRFKRRPINLNGQLVTPPPPLISSTYPWCRMFHQIKCIRLSVPPSSNSQQAPFRSRMTLMTLSQCREYHSCLPTFPEVLIPKASRSLMGSPSPLTLMPTRPIFSCATYQRQGL